MFQLESQFLVVGLIAALLSCNINTTVSREDMQMISKDSEKIADVIASIPNRYDYDTVRLASLDAKGIRDTLIAFRTLIRSLKEIDSEEEVNIDSLSKLNRLTIGLTKSLTTTSDKWGLDLDAHAIQNALQSQRLLSSDLARPLLIETLNYSQTAIFLASNNLLENLALKVSERIDKRVHPEIQYKVEIIPEVTTLHDGDTLRLTLFDFAYYRLKDDSVTLIYQNDTIPLVDGVGKLDFVAKRHWAGYDKDWEILTIQTDWKRKRFGDSPLLNDTIRQHFKIHTLRDCWR